MTRVDESGRNSPKHIFIPVTSDSLSVGSVHNDEQSTVVSLTCTRHSDEEHRQHAPTNDSNDSA